MKTLTTILFAIFILFGVIACEPKEEKLRNIDELITVILNDNSYYIIPLEKTPDGYIARVSKDKFKNVNGTPEEMARQIYGKSVKEARWTRKD